MSELNEYQEGERIARTAIQEGIPRKQLDQLAKYAATHNIDAVRYQVKKQGAREAAGWTVEFQGEIFDLTEKATPAQISRILGIAHDLHPYVENERTTKLYGEKRQEIERLVMEYANRFRLGFQRISARVSEGRFTIVATFDRKSFDKGAAFREISNAIRAKIPEFRNIYFQIYFE